ncbi:MAG: hypothetical protein SFW67_01510 [Myxococcaceae bacterium]|nr:hypothetical protein [Myxococcaceae bacterium]
MKRVLLLLALSSAAVSLANGRADCQRNCVSAQKGFDKQCKETAKNDPDSKAGCDMVAKKFKTTCEQACQRGEKMKKPANTNGF